MARLRLSKAALAAVAPAVMVLATFALVPRLDSSKRAPEVSAPTTTANTLPAGFLSATTVVEDLNGMRGTATTGPVVKAPLGVGGSPRTTSAGRQPTATGGPVASGTAIAPLNTVPPVFYGLSGSCAAASEHYACRISLTASDRLESAGFITVYPGVHGEKGCSSSGPVVRDAVDIAATCTDSYSPAVLAIYSLTPAAGQVPLASTTLAWTRGN